MLCIFGGCHRRDYDNYPQRRPYGPRGIAPGRDRYDRHNRYDMYDRYDNRDCSECRSMYPRNPWRY